jgi:putative ABC transport system permease protein
VLGLPTTGASYTSDFTIEGRPPEEYGKEVRHVVITPDYFDLMRIPLISGRTFNSADTSDSSPVIIITDSLARRHFPKQDAVGQRIKFTKPEVASDWYTIVGVASNVKQEGLGLESRPQVYEPFSQNSNTFMNLVIRTTGDPHNIVSAVVGEIKAVDKDLPPYDIKTMDEVMSSSVSTQRFTMLLLAIFAGTALLLASVGIYGVMSYTISQRTGEIGIRMALGAQRRNVLAMILGQGLILVMMGLAIGALGAFATTWVMRSLLYNVSATDPLVFVLISLLLTGVAMLACFVPARRATKIDPIHALRYE